MSDLIACLLWLAMLAFAVFLIGWSCNLWTALGWS